MIKLIYEIKIERRGPYGEERINEEAGR